ncbi:MAG: glycosyltransferase family 2 protein [Actinobacteria bacterium]|nr:glycosyltransferase family 2 protein [Actinomycetota bacterium]
MKKKIAVLITAYNEQDTIGNIIQEIKKIIDDVIVVDDGSIDDTVRIAQQNGAKVISHHRNQGKGAALKTGFNYAKSHGYDGVVTMDGDGQHLPSELNNFLFILENSDPDIILGNRMENTIGMPFHRLLTNIFTSKIISRRAHQLIKDSQCGYRYISTKVLSSIILKTRRFDSENELLMRASWKGFKIEHVPISTIYFEKRESRIKPVRDSWRFFLMIIRSYKWKRDTLKSLAEKHE